jgi:starch synthase
MLLMPSHYEPCGLNQIYSLRYGTAPVVRATGGLDDTIEAFDPATENGTGFKFVPYTGAALLACLEQALRLFNGNRAAWRRLLQNGMEKDFSWKKSAAEYERLYQQVVKTPVHRYNIVGRGKA